MLFAATPNGYSKWSLYWDRKKLKSIAKENNNGDEQLSTCNKNLLLRVTQVHNLRTYICCHHLMHRASVSDGETKATCFQRIWSEEDEIALLQGIMDYKETSGLDPSNGERKALYDLLKPHISASVTSVQFFQKKRALKKKFKKDKNKGSKPNNHKLFHLSKLIWVVEEISYAEKDELKTGEGKEEECVSVVEALTRLGMDGLAPKITSSRDSSVHSKFISTTCPLCSTDPLFPLTTRTATPLYFVILHSISLAVVSLSMKSQVPIEFEVHLSLAHEELLVNPRLVSLDHDHSFQLFLNHVGTPFLCIMLSGRTCMFLYMTRHSPLKVEDHASMISHENQQDKSPRVEMCN
ncbi:hypothetical protein YC2023_009101 [Brassica napus]